MDTLKSLVHWFLRLALAAIFIYHGVGKYPMAVQMAQMLKMSVGMIYTLATAETLAGLLILYGGFKIPLSVAATRIAGLIMAVVMVGAISLVHWPQWSFMATEAKPMGGMEFQVTLLALSLYFLVRGNEV